ncbi:MAG: acyl-CoA thioesterase [Rhodobacteraceae bacterium]|jgi:4-hydroxybenzoyl-CoA thioesterase|nr:acyl-CoA thioesterase [Paracoccaceae bacterium]
MHFEFPQKVLFKHCDPAGIVFYPRFFEMINDAVEFMFSDLIGWPFDKMHPTHGAPTAEFKVRFVSPCFHGDHLKLQITLNRLGGSSLSLTTRAFKGDQLCFEADQVLVCVGSTGRPNRWPDDVRHTITTIMEAST